MDRNSISSRKLVEGAEDVFSSNNDGILGDIGEYLFDVAHWCRSVKGKFDGFWESFSFERRCSRL